MTYEEKIKEKKFMFPLLEKLSDKALVILKEDAEKIEGEEIELADKFFSVELIKTIISNNYFFDYLINNSSFAYIYEDNGAIKGSKYMYGRLEIMELMVILVERGIIELDDNSKENYKKIQDVANFMKEYSNTIKEYTVENKRLMIPFSYINRYLIMSPKESDNFFNTKQMPKEIEGFSIEEYCYMVKKFIDEEKILTKFPKLLIKTNYNKLVSNKNVDIECINQFNYSINNSIDEIEINKDLEKSIFEGMDENYSEIEKAIFIYIKMCKLFTYDDKFYVFDQSGEIAKQHENIDNVKNITLENNKLVCYEFNAIYAKLLSKIGIKYETKENDSKNFSGLHVNLKFKSCGFHVKADSVKSIFDSDMTKAKLNMKLGGLECLNSNNDTKRHFRDLVEKVQLKINENNNTEDLIKLYEKFAKPTKELDVYEKMEILLDKLNIAALEGLDDLSYAYILRKQLFNPSERDKNVVFNRVRLNNIIENNNEAKAILIISLSEENLKENDEDIYYYIHEPGKTLEPISKEELKNKIIYRDIEYIKEEHDRIPGIRGLSK